MNQSKNKPGDLILDGLELGSRFTWDLALAEDDGL